VDVYDAELDVGGTWVTLTTSPMNEGTVYTLTVNGVTDDSGNPVAPDSEVVFTYQAMLLPEGLVAYWPMSEGAGSTFEDLGPYARTGSLHGASWDPAGKLDSALEFSSSSDHADVGSWSVTSGAITISAWFNADTFTVGDARIVSKATGQEVEDHWFMLSTISDSDMTLRFRLKAGGSTATLVADSGSITAGTWTHGVAVYNGGTMKLYLNGTEVGAMTKSGLLDVDDSVDIYIGNNPVDNKPFDGSVDEVRIYDRALTETEIQMLADEAPPPPYAVTLTDLLMQADRFEIRYPSQDGVLYRLQWSQDITQPDWSDVTTLTGDGGMLSFPHTNEASSGIYRIMAE
jgi:hypothetical protein